MQAQLSALSYVIDQKKYDDLRKIQSGVANYNWTREQLNTNEQSKTDFV